MDKEKFLIDMIHNMEELAELQQEISKMARGNMRYKKLNKELSDVFIAIANVKMWMNEIKNTETSKEEGI